MAVADCGISRKRYIAAIIIISYPVTTTRGLLQDTAADVATLNAYSAKRASTMTVTVLSAAVILCCRRVAVQLCGEFSIL
jgi:hypothetical protein